MGFTIEIRLIRPFNELDRGLRIKASKRKKAYFCQNFLLMKLKRLCLLGISLFVLATNLISQETTSLRNDLFYLASPELKGRFPGTNEDSQVTRFIQQRFHELGLEMPFNNGIQTFKVVTSVEATNDNRLIINGQNADYGVDYSLYAFSSNRTLDADVVYAGFGIVVETDSLKRSDYAGLDVKGKWVLLLKGDPEPQNNGSPFIPFSDARTKAMFAKDRGALGVIFTGGIQNDKNDELVPLLFERAFVNAGLPVLDVKRAFLEKTISGLSVDSLEAKAIRNEKHSQNDIHLSASAHTFLKLTEVTTQNIIGILRGKHPVLQDEYIVIGAHHDHLGMGGKGSGSRMPDTLAPHLGADDNASGTATVLALAKRFANEETKPDRSLIFVLFGAEEMGLLGSDYFVKNLPVEKEKIYAMFNFDMVGRLNDSKILAIGGTGTSKETEEILHRFAEKSPLKFSYSPEGFGPSDHASFYKENIPVFYFTTGSHTDYHTPADSPEKINYQGMSEIADFAKSIIGYLADRPEHLSFTEAGPKEQKSARRGFKVTLGIMPDYTGASDNGLSVGGVTKGGAAERAGLKKGDVITGLNGMPVGNIYDYMNRLKQLKPGQRVNVDLLRDGQPIVLIVDL